MKENDNKHYNPHSHDAVLSRIETTLDSISEKIDEVVDAQEDQRLRTDHLYNKYWWIMGASAGLGTVGGIIVTFVPKLLTH